MPTPAADVHDVLDVLTRSGAARDTFCSAVGEAADIDAQLVADLLRAAGRVGATLDTRRTLVELCALLRALDAAHARRITLTELRDGLAVHAARTDRFAAFHDARVLLRTLEDLLARPEALLDDVGAQTALRAQVKLLHESLREWLLEQLTGSPTGDLPADGAADPAASAPPAPRDAYRVIDPAARAHADALVTELEDGARHHPVTGILGAAWLRDWAAVPIIGDRLGDDAAELERLASALGLLVTTATSAGGPAELLQINRLPSPRWYLAGRRLHAGDQLRDAWQLPATRAGLTLATDPDARRAATIVTTPDLAFAYVEDDGWHALLGPRTFVEAVLGRPQLEGIAAFREHVEELAVEDEPPPDLLEVAMRFGRLRRRAR